MRLLIFAALIAAVAFAFSAAAQAQVPKEGEAAPKVELPAVNAAKVLPDKKDGDKLSLKEFEGKKNVVLFFFPKAMTKG